MTPSWGVSDPGEKAQEGGLAGTRGADEKKPLPVRERKVFNVEAEGVAARPGETHARHADDIRNGRITFHAFELPPEPPVRSHDPRQIEAGLIAPDLVARSVP